jgi:hypothetical protein
VDKPIFGLRNEYSVVFSAGGQRQLSPEEAGRRLFGPVVSGALGRSVLLRNGSHGLYYRLQRSGAVERTARDIDIFEAKTVPPAPGRYRQAG